MTRFVDALRQPYTIL